MIFKYIAKNIHKYNRLKIELSLIDSTLGEDYPVVKIITKHLRKELHNINELKKELEEYYETDKSKDNKNNT